MCTQHARVRDNNNRPRFLKERAVSRRCRSSERDRQVPFYHIPGGSFFFIPTRKFTPLCDFSDFLIKYTHTQF